MKRPRFDGAAGHVVALPAQVQPHLAGTEPDPELVLGGSPDQLDDLGVAQGPFRRRPAAGLVVGAGGDRASMLGQHGADRLDPQPARSRPFGQPFDQVVAVLKRLRPLTPRNHSSRLAT